MASFNKVIITGNLTRDPELRVTPKGTSICQFGIAINRTFKDESGATRDDTTFVDIEAWGKTGELIAKYLEKGSQALIEGRLKLDQWEDKQSGQKRSKLKVVAEGVQFLGSPRGGEQGQQSDPGGHSEPKQSDRAHPEKTASAAGADEDIPF